MTESEAERARGTFLAEVLANEAICDSHYRLILDVGAFPPTQPGQFVQLLCGPPEPPAAGADIEWGDGRPPQFTQSELIGREPLLRRPFSLAGRRDHAHGASELDIIYRVIGTGTNWLTTVQPGQPLSLLGPLGKQFAISADKPRAVLVGGGVGIPPMLYLAEALRAAGKQTVGFMGARSADLLPLRLLPGGEVRADGQPTHSAAELAAHGVDTGLVTDDGSLGLGGFVHQALERWLAEGGCDPQDLVVYACGPELMMRAVGDLCIAADIECYLSLERYMACGMGTCQSCVCKLRSETDQGWAYKLCCKDGPVFEAADIVWDS